MSTEDNTFKWNILYFIEKMLNLFWEKETVPAQFKESIIRPFLKPGKNPRKRENYRPVSLLNVFMKLYEQIIKERLVKVLEKISFFSDFQAGYRKYRSTVDHILVIQEMFYHYRYSKLGPKGATGKQPLYLVFLDLKKAFDSVPRFLLIQKLRHIGLPEKFVNVIDDLYTKNKARVRIEGHMSDYFEINSGVMQGSKLGPILFILFIDDLLKELEASKLGAKMGEIIVTVLGFADDIVLIADTPENVQKLLDICSNWAKRNGMSYNTDKCKVMLLNVHDKNCLFSLDKKELEIVKIYKYLGLVICNTRKTSLFTRHVSLAIKKAEKRINCIRHFGFERDGLRIATSVWMYKVLVRPIL